MTKLVVAVFRVPTSTPPIFYKHYGYFSCGIDRVTLRPWGNDENIDIIGDIFAIFLFFVLLDIPDISRYFSIFSNIFRNFQFLDNRYFLDI